MIYQGLRAQLSLGETSPFVFSSAGYEIVQLQSMRRSCRVCRWVVVGRNCQALLLTRCVMSRALDSWSLTWQRCTPAPTASAPLTLKVTRQAKNQCCFWKLSPCLKSWEDHTRAGPRVENLLELTSFLLKDSISCSRGPAKPKEACPATS